MKNKILVRVLLITFCAFALYLANLRRLQESKLKIIGPRTEEAAKPAKNKQQAKLARPRASKKTGHRNTPAVQIAKGSQKQLAQKIKRVMGNSRYQVSVQDLNNAHRFVKIANSQGGHHVNGTMRLYLVLAVYQQEKKGKLGAQTAIKIKKKDRGKGKKMLQTGMSYGIQYLRQAAMKGDQTAANALLRKVGVKRVNQVALKMNARQTKILHRFSAVPVGQTTANDLTATMVGIYQGRLLGRQYAYSALGALRNDHSKLTKKIRAAAYGVGDAKSATALVQDQGHSYCLSVWSSNNQKFAKLGQSIARWFKKH